MARRRFFVPPLRNATAELTGDDAHHLTRVLRVEPGQRYEIVSGGEVYLAEVDEARKNRVCFRVLEPVARKPLPVSIALYFALFKFDRLEWLLEKCTEAGVTRFVPVIATRSEKGLDRAADKRRARWERILLESAQQSRRDEIPGLDPLTTFARIERAGECSLLLDESADALPILHRLDAASKQAREVSLLLGPEGGWTEAERLAATASGWRAVSVGPQILRSETAAVAACSIVTAVWSATASAVSKA